jgi:hypothetical protein
MPKMPVHNRNDMLYFLAVAIAAFIAAVWMIS